MAVANNWEVLITRGIITAPKTVIIISPEPPKYEAAKRFAWLTSAIWTRALVEVSNGKG